MLTTSGAERTAKATRPCAQFGAMLEFVVFCKFKILTHRLKLSIGQLQGFCRSEIAQDVVFAA